MLLLFWLRSCCGIDEVAESEAAVNDFFFPQPVAVLPQYSQFLLNRVMHGKSCSVSP